MAPEVTATTVTDCDDALSQWTVTIVTKRAPLKGGGAICHNRSHAVSAAGVA